MVRKYDEVTELADAQCAEREHLIDRARLQADDVSALIQAGKRVPRNMTEDLRNRVRELINLLESH